MNSRRFLSACSIIVLALSSSALAQTPPEPVRRSTNESTYIISDDGASITERIRFSDGHVGEFTYFWQR